jgi:hypothetical protein
MSETNEIEELRDEFNLPNPDEEEKKEPEEPITEIGGTDSGEAAAEMDKDKKPNTIPVDVEREFRLQNIELRLIRQIDGATVEGDLDALEILVHAYEVLFAE